MAKARKKKEPVTNTLYGTARRSNRSISGSHLIRKFHVLLKRREVLLAGDSSSTSLELANIEDEIQNLGGLEAYQKMSARGQDEERGGGSEKVFVEWLKDGREKCEDDSSKLNTRLLEVGALKHDNYAHATWIDCIPIDLRPRHPLIKEQNFLKMNEQTHIMQWDAISLSLVLNFVPNPHDRGKMLMLAYKFLRPGGYLFLALPLPCVANSRYLDFDHFKHIMTTLGFAALKERWKPGGRMAYWLYQKVKDISPEAKSGGAFSKKVILREGKHRNNFTILL
ncbi:nucleolus protein [Ramaria rubella]|nr:nucleolus protein [Ramaria rubella]